jgi:hypothetical protein
MDLMVQDVLVLAGRPGGQFGYDDALAVHTCTPTQKGLAFRGAHFVD